MTSDRDKVIDGIEASRRVGWAKYYDAEARVQYWEDFYVNQISRAGLLLVDLIRWVAVAEYEYMEVAGEGEAPAWGLFWDVMSGLEELADLALGPRGNVLSRFNVPSQVTEYFMAGRP